MCVEAKLRRTSSSWRHKIAGRLGTNLRPKLNCTGMQQTTGELAPREKFCTEQTKFISNSTNQISHKINTVKTRGRFNNLSLRNQEHFLLSDIFNISLIIFDQTTLSHRSFKNYKCVLCFLQNLFLLFQNIHMYPISCYGDISCEIFQR